MKKNLLSIWIAAVCLPLSFVCSWAQSSVNGAVSYFLPNTSLVIEAEAVKEIFYAGPYAKYAQKYLGIEVRQEDEVNYTLSAVSITPYSEADQSERYYLDFGASEVSAGFLQLTSLGLISRPEANYGQSVAYRFGQEQGGQSADNGLISNVDSKSTTLYQGVESGDGFTKVGITQKMTVAKTLEAKAAETAELILKLRQDRINILVGDTDATYSGEALGAAVESLEKLEKEYLTMFLGYSVTSVQKEGYELVPNAQRTIYVAFRFSSTSGLLSSEDSAGKPIVLDIETSEIVTAQPSSFAAGKQSKPPAAGAIYRFPSICTV